MSKFMRHIYSAYFSKYSELTKEETMELIKKTEKPFKYTHGLGFRNPTIHNVEMTRNEAIDKFENDFCDVREYDDYIHLNTYGNNDLW